MSAGRPRSPRGEDLTFMATNGETHRGAAERLGTNVLALEKWCRNNGHHATWARLVANARVPGRGARSGSLALAGR